MKQDITEQESNERTEQAETFMAMRTRGRFKNDTPIILVMRDIQKNGAKRYQGTYIDSFSASAFIAVWDNLNLINKLKLENLAKKSLVKAVSVCFKLCK